MPSLRIAPQKIAQFCRDFEILAFEWENAEQWIQTRLDESAHGMGIERISFNKTIKYQARFRRELKKLGWTIARAAESWGIRHDSLDAFLATFDRFLWQGACAIAQEVLIRAETIAHLGTARVRNRTGKKSRSRRTKCLSSPPTLSDRKKNILLALLALRAFDSDSRVTTAEIAARAESKYADPDAFKDPIAQLTRSDLVKTKTGRGGGCWLTESGRVRAGSLNER